MGHAIVYCSNCSAQIRDADFEKRRAFKIDDQMFCSPCCREILGYEPAEDLSPTAANLIAQRPRPSGSSSTARRLLKPAPAAAASSSSTLWIVGAILAGAFVIAALLLISGGGHPDAPPPAPPPATPSTPPPAARRPSSEDAAAQVALARALRFAGE